MPSSAACTRSASWPRTTTSGSMPAFDTRPTTRRTRVSPSSSMRSLFCPMRVDMPAASTIPAIDPSRSGMDSLRFCAQVAGLLPRKDSQQLGDDADGDLFRALGAKRQANRSEHSRIVTRAELAENAFGSRAWAQQTDVLRAGGEKAFQPVAIVSQRVGHDDDQRATVDVQPVYAGFGSSAKEALC